MILEYDVKTGVIVAGISSRELRRGSDNMFDSKPQNYFSDHRGLPRSVKPGHAIKSFRDSEISLNYLNFLRDENGKPIWKFLLKDGKPVRIVPISGVYPALFLTSPLDALVDQSRITKDRII